MKHLFFIPLILSLFFTSSVHAFKVMPMVAEMAPLGKNSQLSMRVENTGKSSLTVEMVPLSLTLDQYGNETLVSAEDELLILPVTAIIEPGRSQSILVRYLGDPSISKSKAYRVSFRQVQVERRDINAASIGVLINFDTLINVRPENTKPILDVVDIRENNNQWEVDINNSGQSYGRLSNTNWRLSDSKKSQFWNSKMIGNNVTGSLILPNSTRTFTMNPQDNLNIESLNIEIELVK